MPSTSQVRCDFSDSGVTRKRRDRWHAGSSRMMAHQPIGEAAWPFVKTWVALDEVDSTSDHAARLVRVDDVALPLLVWSKRQTRGRGRSDHRWWSDDGSLTFTFVIDPAAHGLEARAE